MNLSEIAEKLRAPFGPDEVEWRVGTTTKDKTKGMALAYIDARTVMRRLDDVIGPFGWQCENKELRGGKMIICSIGIRMENGEWIWKSDGAGDTAVEAEKGCLSDAFKRAAVRWGIGRYLYELPSPWVTLEADGRRIAPSELPRLQRIIADCASGNLHTPSLQTASHQAHEANGSANGAHAAHAAQAAQAGPGLRRTRPAGRPGPTQPGAVASDIELDSKWGDPLVRFDPREWKGRSYVGAHYSQTEPAYLDLLAKAKERQADNPKPGKEQYAESDRRDAALARGWAQRLRSQGLAGSELAANDYDPTAEGAEAVF